MRWRRTKGSDVTVTDDNDLDLDRLVPLGALVAEGLGASVDQLAAKISDAVFVDDVGLRCCTRETARSLIAERAAEQAQQRARRAAAAAQMDRRTQETRARLRALGEREPSGNAHADLHHDER